MADRRLVTDERSRYAREGRGGRRVMDQDRSQYARDTGVGYTEGPYGGVGDYGLGYGASDRAGGYGDQLGGVRYAPLHADEGIRNERRVQTRGEHYGRGPRNYTRPDERIHEDVVHALTDDHMVDATDVDVRVNAGEVTLEGTVADRWQKRRAEDVAEHVRGVRDVFNHLRVARDQREQEAVHIVPVTDRET